MVYITHLIYVLPEHKDLFCEYENLVLPILSRHDARLLLRIAPTVDMIVEQTIDTPDEIHVLTFPSEQSLQDYLVDPERLKHGYIREEAIQSSIVIKGVAI